MPKKTHTIVWLATLRPKIDPLRYYTHHLIAVLVNNIHSNVKIALENRGLTYTVVNGRRMISPEEIERLISEEEAKLREKVMKRRLLNRSGRRGPQNRAKK
jgi:hypothetical protein